MHIRNRIYETDHLARHFTEQKLRVGIITNDQGENLVDTHLVKVEGFNVKEVTGGCFCCRLTDFTDVGEQLLNQFFPDVILAEPVGSCTDLVATVIQPLKMYAKDDYAIDPFTVLVDPLRAKEIVLSGGTGGFSDNVTYIFRKQLEEADIIGLNKIDTLNAQQRQEILATLKKRYPQANVMGISALTGEGFRFWLSALEAKGAFGRNIAEVDYEVYATGEAELAWLNFVADLSSSAEFDGDAFLVNFTEHIRQGLARISAEAAHLKLALSTTKGSSVINLVSTHSPARLSLKRAGRIKEGHLIVNARVHTDPETLRNIVTSGLMDLSQQQSVAAKIKSVQSFRPGRPVPVHRFKKIASR